MYYGSNVRADCPLPRRTPGARRLRVGSQFWYQRRYHFLMAMTLRLADDESEALRRRSELEQRSMQEVARQAIREYIENHSRSDLLDQVLDEELPRYAEALRRLGE